MDMKHVFICGAKSFGQYGGFETFVDKLTQYHRDQNEIRYHIACKANGNGSAGGALPAGAEKLPDENGKEQFIYHNTHCFRIRTPDLGALQSVLYDIAAIRYSIDYCKRHGIRKPVIYVLTCRIGPFIGRLRKQIRKAGGKLVINPDGHEWQREKWSFPIRKYWKYSEKKMVAAADRVVCDSKEIEAYVRGKYGKNAVTFIPYGAETDPSVLADDDPAFLRWMEQNGLEKGSYYLMVCRFVPENSFREIIAAFMKSSTRKKLAVITTEDAKYFSKLEKELHFSSDPRICFTGTLYDQELLKKVRENAFAYIHGHTAGGTNPTLLEAMALTKVCLLRDVGFNREVGKDTVLYWKSADLADLIARMEALPEEDRSAMGRKAADRIRAAYSWERIAEDYLELWRSCDEE